MKNASYSGVDEHHDIFCFFLSSFCAKEIVATTNEGVLVIMMSGMK